MGSPGKNGTSTQSKIEYRKLAIRPVLPPQVQRLIGKLKKNYSFFSDMDENEISDFIRLCSQESYEPGQTIFSKGDVATVFYLVVLGEVKITIEGEAVATLAPGEIFGEMAVLEDIPRTASASAVGITVLLSVAVNVLTSKMPVLANKVLLSVAQQMSARLRRATANPMWFK